MTTELGRNVMRYIVVYEDENSGMCWPMGWDDECQGAISAMTNGTVAIFDGKASARQAIRVSTAYAKLRQVQCLPFNDDFLSGIKNVKLVECKSA